MKRRHAKRPPAATAGLATFSTEGGAGRLALASPEPATADTEARTLTGLVVPFGKAGATSGGRLKFSKGSLSWSADPKRVKLLREHDQAGDVIGHAVEFTETDAGVVGTFRIPATPAGDLALLEASEGLRDGFSVGVQLDDATLTRLRRSQGAAVEAAGDLREVSTVSVPAFDDARMAAHADLVVSTWSDPTDPAPTTAPPTATAGGTTTTGGTPMTEAQRQRLAQLLAQASLSQAEATERDQLQQLATAAGITVTGETVTHQQPATADASVPAVVPAVAGAAHVTAEPPTYTFGLGEPGGAILVQDLYRSRVEGDAEAAQRVTRFNAELRENNPGSVQALLTASSTDEYDGSRLATAAATRDNIDGSGTDLPPAFSPSPYRPDLMRALVDVKRPFMARLAALGSRIPLTNAQPFAIPTVGEFEGVDVHTEGTPHVPAGTLTLGVGGQVQPVALSGAWEASRELLDAATPVLDRIALRAMSRDYARKSEGRVGALFAARAAQEGANVYGVNTPLQMRAALLDFVNDDEEGADVSFVSKGMLRTLGLDTDTTERPQLPYVGAVNALGSVRAGFTGLAIDGVELARAARLDTLMPTDAGSVGVLARAEGVLVGESPVAQFRFDEVLGPGVIKLALWAYHVAAILDTNDVAILRTGADPTP